MARTELGYGTPESKPSATERGLAEGVVGSPTAGGAPIITQDIERLLEKAKPEEWKYVLKLKLQHRVPGCGWKYLYGWDLEPVYGEVNIVTLKRKEHYDCTVETELLIIPKSVPAVLKVYEWDDDPQVTDRVVFYIMTHEGWRSVETLVLSEAEVG